MHNGTATISESEIDREDWYKHHFEEDRIDQTEPIPQEEITKWKAADASRLATYGNSKPYVAPSDMEKLLEEVEMTPTGSYPPTNIIRSSGGYKIEIAVAGFSENDLSVTVEGNSLLLIRGTKENNNLLPNEGYVTQGIATRKFQRVITMGKGVEVVDSVLKDGILTVNLKRPIPEPITKVIPINKKPQFLAEVAGTTVKVDPRWTGTPTQIGRGIGMTANTMAMWPMNNTMGQNHHDGAMAAPLSPEVNITVQHK
jgi:HSP20 family molecular chaperone IbpA